MYDVIIIGAGASGLMAAIEAAKRGRRVLVVDHAGRVGRKLLVSGGGKCNVTNTYISASDYFGADNSFCKHALNRFTTGSILGLLHKADIKTEERDHGRIFCKKGADELVSYLLQTSEKYGVHFSLNTEVSEVSYTTCFQVKCGNGMWYESQNLLVATGGLAWPQTGATDLGYRIARQFGHKVTPLKPALTGFILPQDSPLLNLQGISLDVQIRITGKSPVIEEPLLFTHRGISGPSVLQGSCFWEKGDVVTINFLPSEDVISQMHEPRNGKLFVKNLFMHFLPERLVKAIIPDNLSERKVAELGKKERNIIAECVHSFPVYPDSVEGFSKAEVTVGGVCTGEINPESMESLLLKGLFFSGEVIDITGRLGGYNIHWAFASGYVAGECF
ncbi:MAG: NAD(P)/FAD-dependent oxidoreductase [Tannerella sp.]|jgi:predicted Rossmann fold flavoprotein|nr:NAD(P)/FAD-dependent oxidoreductase [Tannerella sp.]